MFGMQFVDWLAGDVFGQGDLALTGSLSFLCFPLRLPCGDG